MIISEQGLWLRLLSVTTEDCRLVDNQPLKMKLLICLNEFLLDIQVLIQPRSIQTHIKVNFLALHIRMHFYSNLCSNNT